MASSAVEKSRDKSSVTELLPFSVLCWSAWSPVLQDDAAWSAWALHDGRPEVALGESGVAAPPIQFLPLAMRKKLSGLCKLVLFLSHQIIGEESKIPIVLGTRHGEMALTLNLLESVGKNEACSPMVFSRSVMNSSLGLQSIFAGNKAASTAVAAMEKTFESALLESLLRLHTESSNVLFLYVEEAVAEVFYAVRIRAGGQLWDGLSVAASSEREPVC